MTEPGTTELVHEYEQKRISFVGIRYGLLQDDGASAYQVMDWIATIGKRAILTVNGDKGVELRVDTSINGETVVLPGDYILFDDQDGEIFIHDAATIKKCYNRIE